ncbi:MAG: peptidoglycan DD-metalloendopeptidase family protein [Flavobacteriales bacterium]
MIAVWAQDRYTLKKKSQILKSEIQKLNAQAQHTKKQASKTFSHLQRLSKNIKIRTQLISNIQKERHFIGRSIDQRQHEVSQLRKDLTILKREYNNVLVQAYKNRVVQQKILLFLSSTNLGQVFKRLKYLEKYSNFQEERATKLHYKQGELTRSVQKLQQDKQEKQSLVQQQEKQKVQLESEKEDQNKLMRLLQKTQKNLISSIQMKQAEARRLDRQIQILISSEIRLAKLRVEKAARRRREGLVKKGKESIKGFKYDTYHDLSLSVEESKLASYFASNKGKLPWPVAQGTVLNYFGKQPYPGLQGVYVDNSGVDILTPKGADAKAIFQGTVSAVYLITGGVKAVLIQHGNYYSVYNNLQETYVHKGNRVKINQSLGRIYTNAESQTLLNFQIWYNTLKQNPAHWVKGL